MKTITLYRPIGEKELILIAKNGFKAFPPRLEWQPIFYPVLNEGYASEIASQWNTNDKFGNYLGFVTKFEITQTEYDKYKIEQVGGDNHKELWVPSEKLSIFNDSIVGEIEVTKVYIGTLFKAPENDIIKEIINNIKNIHL
jgi:hypothetical protein